MPRVLAVLTPTVIVAILVTLVFLACGQVLFKQAAADVSFTRPMSLLSWRILLALTVYGTATLGWLFVLSRVPLSVAFPFYGVTFLLVPLFSWGLLGETVRPQTWAGGVVIVIGVIICSWGAEG